jgi:hypothetical protein
VTDTSGFSDPNQITELVVDNEVIRTLGSSGNNLLIYNRGSSGGGPPAAHSAGATVSLAGRQLLVTGANTIYRDFEVMSSDPARDAIAFPARGWGRGDGVVNAGSGNKFINLVVHDNLDGIVTSGASTNTEVYGNVIYNNGLMSQNEGLGHGMYLENSSGYSKIYSNLVFNSFNLGMQAYGVTAPYSGGDLQDNVYANSGAPLGTSTRNRNAVIGPESQRIPSINILRNHFYHQSNTNSYGVILGYGAGISSCTFSNNYIIGGGTQLEIQNTSSLTGQGNQIYSSTPSIGGYLKIDGTLTAFSWNNNTYHNAGTQTRFASNTNLYNFTSWKTATGFDSGGTATAVAMPNQVIVIPNSYEPGRANVIIYNTSGASTVQINLTQAGLTNGQTYEIRDAENYFGPLVRTGTYNSTSPTVSIPMTGLTVAQPMGLPKRSHTAPEFGIFVVIKTSPSQMP